MPPKKQSEKTLLESLDSIQRFIVNQQLKDKEPILESKKELLVLHQAIKDKWRKAIEQASIIIQTAEYEIDDLLGVNNPDISCIT